MSSMWTFDGKGGVGEEGAGTRSRMMEKIVLR